MFEEFRRVFVEAAIDALPNEMVGVIFDGKFIRVENSSENPTVEFRMTASDVSKYKGAKLQAVVHSHPATPIEEDGPPVSRLCPSLRDMEGQIATGVPWVIVAENAHLGTWEMFDWGAHTLDLPLLERPFRHGVEDCYELIRKERWQRLGDKLPPMPRDNGWWGDPLNAIEASADLYLDHFEACGAVRVYPHTPGDLKVGDVFLHKLGSTKFNHGGVFVGNGKIIHHPPGKLSHSAPVGPWFRRLDIWLRKE